MKFGHTTGHKREHRGTNAWYQSAECEELIRRLEAEEAAQQQKSQQGK